MVDESMKEIAGFEHLIEPIEKRLLQSKKYLFSGVDIKGLPV